MDRRVKPNQQPAPRQSRLARKSSALRYIPRVEQLEDLTLLNGTMDFGDAPVPYDTLLIDNGASHEAVGPTLGSNRDTEADGQPTSLADGDDTAGVPNDEDGVTFGTLQVGQLGATVTVNVQNAPSGARLDAWLDLNRDGSWGGPFEQIADNVMVSNGDNVLTFDIPAFTDAGVTYARFRLSTAGNLGQGGTASDGEVEDYQVTILANPETTDGFSDEKVVAFNIRAPQAIAAADIDGDGDMDLFGARRIENRIAWYENDGNENFTEHVFSTAVSDPQAIIAADLDGDGDLDALTASWRDDRIAWYENDGSQNFTQRTISTTIERAFDVFAADIDGDGDMDVAAAGQTGVTWFDNDGNQNFIATDLSGSITDAEAVFAADVDSDGDMDLAGVGRNSRVVWYANDGNQNFVEHLLTTDVNVPRDLVLADIDSDGDMDAAVASEFGGFDWFENDGNENFSRHILISSIPFPTSVTAADVDGDGDTDVLGTSGSFALWYENDGNENFTQHTLATGSAVQQVVVADIDGDTGVDLAVAEHGGERIFWLKGLGGLFDYGDAPAPYPTVLADDGARHAATGPTLGDLRDGDPNGQPALLANGDDISHLSDEDGVAIPAVLQQGQTGSITVNVQSAPSGARLDGWLDFNSDGDWTDVGEQIATNLLVGEGDHTLVVPVPTDAFVGLTYARFRLSSAGNLAPTGEATDGEVEDYSIEIIEPVIADLGDAPAPYPTTVAQRGPRHEPAGPTLGANRDTESDGQPSAAADGDDTTSVPDDEDGVTFGAIRVGQLGATITVNVQNALSGAKLDAWLDLNGDGSWGGPLEQIADNVTVSNGDNVLTFDVPFFARPGDTYTRFRLSTAGNLGVGGVAVDGEVEDYLVTILPNPEIADGFSTANIISTNFRGPWDVFASDLDQDGDTDLLYSATFGDAIAWLENDGNEGFTEHTISTNIDEGLAVFATDLDGDGDLDVLSASARNDRIAWYENDGSQNFTPHDISITADRAWDAVPTDLDGDGDLDVVGAVNTGVVWYENDGSQTFTTNTLDTTLSSLTKVLPIDLDNDGDLDLVASAEGPDLVVWYENDGSQNFTRQTVVTNVDPRDFDVYDLDGDGDLDVVVASNTGTFSWQENDGSENFTQHVFDNIGFPGSVDASDVDGDGDIDIAAVTAANGPRVFWYENDGSQNFTRQELATGASFRDVIAADLDGDGGLDIIASDNSRQQLVWFQGQRGVLDYGDAPAQYPTTFANDGARHRDGGPTLGALRDIESDGQPSTAADGDDTNNLDDEDGVTFANTTLFISGTSTSTSSVQVDLQNADPASNRLDAWIDFNRDGDWDDVGEQILVNIDLGTSNGTQSLNFTIPQAAGANVDFGTSYARFRLSTAGNLAPTGLANDGEVEDYQLTLLPLTIADAGDPYIIDEGESLALSGSVTSPIPSGSLTVRWDIDDDGDFDENITGTTPVLTWTQLNSLGIDDGPAVHTLTIEVDDGYQTVTDSVTLTVANVAPTAAIIAPTLGVPGQTQTFTLEATDPSPADESAGFTFQIDFDGDGTIDQTVVGPSGLQVEHIYTTTGTFTVKVTAEDKDGGVSDHATDVIDIVRVALLPDPTDSTKTTVFVGGTLNDDEIEIEGDSGTVEVFLNDDSLGTFSPTGLTAVVFGQAGDDEIEAEDLESGVWYFGGAGDDQLDGTNHNDLLDGGSGDDDLDGGKGDDILIGGSGDDELEGGQGDDIVIGGSGDDDLEGGKGDDILIGGVGADELEGGQGSDLLIAGSTSFDEDIAALALIFAEWTRDDTDYDTRVAHLTGTQSGGLNGSVLLTSATVFNDDEEDELEGGPGSDLFFVSLSGPGELDSLVDLDDDEVAVEI